MMLISEITTPNIGHLTTLISEQTGFDATVIESVLAQHYSGNWTLMEAKPQPATNRIAVLVSPIFQQSVDAHAAQLPDLMSKIADFIKAKQENPNKPFGTHDYFMLPDGIYGRSIPKIRHAHIYHNVIIMYTLTQNQLKLFGTWTHKELGISTPANFKLQKQKAKELSNLRF